MNWAWATSLDHIWRSPSFPMWVTLAAALFFALVLLITLARAEKSVANGALTVITLLAIGIAVAATIRGFGDGDKAMDAMAPAQTASLAALSCLDGLAGENVEAACEKALFASPDVTAAAVSYTGRQLTRLTAAAANASRSAANPELAAVRRTLERDRFGLVAQVLMTRDRCSPTACEAFRSLADYQQITANMNDKTYDNLVGRHSLAWGAAPMSAGAAPATPFPSAASSAPNVPTGRPTNADFPTAASIPPVNIMGAEPPASSAARAAPPQAAQTAPPAAPRAPSTTAAANSGLAQTPSAAPPPAKRPPAKQQRTSAPVQLAPPAEPDNN